MTEVGAVRPPYGVYEALGSNPSAPTKSLGLFISNPIILGVFMENMINKKAVCIYYS